MTGSVHANNARSETNSDADRLGPTRLTSSIELVLDDGTTESVYGLLGGSARQFLWFNRFSSPGTFQLEEIAVLFPAGTDASVGDSVQLAVFVDSDGDPTNGATLLATYDETIEANDGTTFSVYALALPVIIDQPGDVLIGVVNRYFNTGVDAPPTQPAALDTTSSQNRSYVALWAADAPQPPSLASATIIDVLDGATSGNFAIRGSGTPIGATAIPALDHVGLGVLMVLLLLAGVVRLRAF